MYPERIILFDGFCRLCIFSIGFIVRNDPHAHFMFASLQSEAARKILGSHGISGASIDSLVLVDHNKVYLRSSAILRIAGKLRGAWPLLQAAYIIPAFFRDSIYNFIARNRYRWFGIKDTCMVPDDNDAWRFFDGKVDAL